MKFVHGYATPTRSQYNKSNLNLSITALHSFIVIAFYFFIALTLDEIIKQKGTQMI